MQRGTPISARPVAVVPVANATPAASTPTGNAPTDRVLTTAEANSFLRRAPGFLEKRRSSGIDSPPYIQHRARGAVLYRMSDLIAYEESHVIRSSSDHEQRR